MASDIPEEMLYFKSHMLFEIKMISFVLSLELRLSFLVCEERGSGFQIFRNGRTMPLWKKNKTAVFYCTVLSLLPTALGYLNLKSPADEVPLFAYSWHFYRCSLRKSEKAE